MYNIIKLGEKRSEEFAWCIVLGYHCKISSWNGLHMNCLTRQKAIALYRWKTSRGDVLNLMIR